MKDFAWQVSILTGDVESQAPSLAFSFYWYL